LQKALAALVIMGCGIQAVLSLSEAETQPVLSLPQLLLRLSSVKMAKARFTERKYLHILTAPLEDSGTLIYIAPSVLQKNTLQPKFERLLVDRDTLTIERERKTQTLKLADYPQAWSLIEGIRATLAGDIAALDRYYESRLDGSIGSWRLVLRPRDKKMQEVVQSLRIFGTDTRIDRIETEERDGDHTEMTMIEDGP
jgi:hypothetical protein